MAVRSFPKLLAFLSLFLGGLAFAQEPGSTSGTASGKNVQPSTAIQKENAGPSNAGGGSCRDTPMRPAHPAWRANLVHKVAPPPKAKPLPSRRNKGMADLLADPLSSLRNTSRE